MATVSPDAPIVVLDDFRGGEFSRLGAWQAERNQFTGQNVMVYPDGSLGPRYGVKEVALTGITPTGKVLGFGYNFAADAAGFKDTFFVIGTSVHVMDRDTGAGATCATSLGETATSPIPFVENGVVTYLSVPGGKMYSLTHASTPTITAHTPSSTVFSPGLTCLVRYGERLIAAGSGLGPDGTTAPGNRVYFSDAGTPTAWTSTNYFDVGFGPAVTALVVHRENLLIATSDGKWWTLRGTLGADGNAVLRETLQGVSPNDPTHWAALGDGLLAYVIGSSSTGSIGSVGRFTGTTTRLWDYIAFGNGRSRSPATEPSFTVQPTKEAGDFFIIGGAGNAANDLFALLRGVPTIHELSVSGVTLSGYCSSFVTADFHLFTDGGGASATPKFYRWRAYATRPGLSTDTDAQPGDASTTPFSAYFTTCEFVVPGHDVMVEGVEVEFTAWRTGSATNNFLGLDAIYRDSWEQADSTTKTSGETFDEAGTAIGSSTGDSKTQRKAFYFAEQWGEAASVKFTLKGVAVRRAVVHLKVKPRRLRP